MKDANIFHGKMSDFIHMITESQNIKEIPWKLEQLSKLPAFEIHSFNNISNTLLKETIVAQSIEVLEYTFEVSDKPLIQELFALIEDQSNVSIISLVYKTESYSFVYHLTILLVFLQAFRQKSIHIHHSLLCRLDKCGYNIDLKFSMFFL